MSSIPFCHCILVQLVSWGQFPKTALRGETVLSDFINHLEQQAAFHALKFPSPAFLHHM